MTESSHATFGGEPVDVDPIWVDFDQTERTIGIKEAQAKLHAHGLDRGVEQFVRSEVGRLEGVHDMYGYPESDIDSIPIAVREVREELGQEFDVDHAVTRIYGYLDEEADRVLNDVSLAEYTFGGMLVTDVKRVVRDFPTSSVRGVFDLDGTILPLITPDNAEQNKAMIRSGFVVGMEVAQEETGLGTEPTVGEDRTLQAVLLSARPQESIDRLTGEIEEACPSGNGHIIDRELSKSSRGTKDRVDDFMETMTESDADDILAILNPELPSLLREGEERPELYERMKKLLSGDAVGVDTVTTVKEFLESLDIWSQGKIPKLAQLVRTGEAEDIVYVYYDDGETPKLIQHPRILATQLEPRNPAVPNSVDARFRTLDDPTLLNIEGMVDTEKGPKLNSTVGAKARAIYSTIKKRAQASSPKGETVHS